MAMTEGELQERIVRLSEEADALQATPEYQQWVAELKESIAEIDTHPGRPADEFFDEVIHELEAKKRAAKQ
jgi:hypothetical protein